MFTCACSVFSCENHIINAVSTLASPRLQMLLIFCMYKTFMSVDWQHVGSPHYILCTLSMSRSSDHSPVSVICLIRGCSCASIITKREKGRKRDHRSICICFYVKPCHLLCYPIMPITLIHSIPLHQNATFYIKIRVPSLALTCNKFLYTCFILVAMAKLNVVALCDISIDTIPPPI